MDKDLDQTIKRIQPTRKSSYQFSYNVDDQYKSSNSDNDSNNGIISPLSTLQKDINSESTSVKSKNIN